MADQKPTINPCQPEAYLKELREMTTDLDIRFERLQTAIEEALPQAPPTNPVGQPEAETDYGRPEEEAEGKTDATKEIVKAIDQLDRPARARGITNTRVIQITGADLGDEVLPDNPNRRSLAVSYHPGTIGLVPYPIDDTNSRNAGFFLAGQGVVFLTEEEWGGWVSQAWYHAWPPGGNDYDIIVEEYVQ